MFIRAAATNESKGRPGRFMRRGADSREEVGLEGVPLPRSFFRLEQFAADQILLKNFNASNIE